MCVSQIWRLNWRLLQPSAAGTAWVDACVCFAFALIMDVGAIKRASGEMSSGLRPSVQCFLAVQKHCPLMCLGTEASQLDLVVTVHVAVKTQPRAASGVHYSTHK